MPVLNVYCRILTLTLICAGLAVSLVQGQATAKPNAAQKTPASKQSSNKTAPLAGEHQDAAAADLRAISKPPLPEFHPQQPRRIQFENGMVVFLQEDHELPLIDGTAYIYGGSKIGRASCR